MKEVSKAEGQGSSRVTDTRAFLTREVILRNIGSMDATSPLLDAYKLAPEGYEYGWLREYIGGEYDSGNLYKMEGRGWTPVPASRHPNLFFLTKKAHQDEHDPDACRFRGLRLYERPLEYTRIERETLNTKAIQEISKNPGLTHDSIVNMGYKYKRKNSL